MDTQDKFWSFFRFPLYFSVAPLTAVLTTVLAVLFVLSELVYPFVCLICSSIKDCFWMNRPDDFPNLEAHLFFFPALSTNPEKFLSSVLQQTRFLLDHQKISLFALQHEQTYIVCTIQLQSKMTLQLRSWNMRHESKVHFKKQNKWN